MAKYVASFHGWNEAVVEMQVGSADSSRSDPYDRIMLIQDFRIGHLLYADCFLAPPTSRSHRLPPRNCLTSSSEGGCAGCPGRIVPSEMGTSPASIICLKC